jgi:hypothetical protein
MDVASARRADAFLPAAVGLALFVTVVQIRLDDLWSLGVLLVVAALPAVMLLILGAGADDTAVPTVTILMVAGLALSAIAILRLGNILGGDDYTSAGGTLTWMLAAFAALAAWCWRRTASIACLLLAALATVGLLLAAVHWIFDTGSGDTYRGLLAFSFVALFAAGLATTGRIGTILVGAAGVIVVAGSWATGLVIPFFFGSTEGLGWGWELVTLAEGLALLAYAAMRVERGPGYLAFFVLAIFVISAALGEQGVVSSDIGPDRSHSFLGWPLALGIGTAAATIWGVGAARR